MSANRELTDDEKKLLGQLAMGAKKVIDNAEALYQEASILKNHGAISRAVFLHQISLEECGKAEIMGWWATGVLMGHKIWIGIKSYKR